MSTRRAHGPAGRLGDAGDLELPNTSLAALREAMRARLAAHGRPPVYLSLDIDCLEPAFAPGTGTPEPGGPSTSQVLSVLEELADQPFVGMDCVEVAPPLRPRRAHQPGRGAFRLDLPLRAPRQDLI